MSQSLHAEPQPPQEEPASRNPVLEAFETYVPAALGTLIALGLSFYLLEPWFHQRPHSEQRPHPVKDNLLDCFIVRDASGSIDPTDYENIEQEILSHLSTKDGDRISYAVFGSDTRPRDIQPPSGDRKSIVAQKQVAERLRHEISGTTDFAKLFDRLADTIHKDRQSQAAKKRRSHADAIIIVSDGIPDLTPDNQRCPLSGEELIPDNVVDSYDALVNSFYATQEPIYVRLVLVGTQSDCGPEIKGEWERRLGPKGLEVISYSELGRALDFGGETVEPLRRHPRITLRMNDFEDEQRRNLDRGAKLSVQISAQSFLQGGRVRIESAALAGKNGELRLHTLKNERTRPTDGERRYPEIFVPSPADGTFWGDPVDDEVFYLQPELASADFVPVESEAYELRLKASILDVPEPGRPVPSVEVEPLQVQPCHRAEQKRQIRERLEIPARLSFALGAFFALGVAAWFVTKGAARGSAIDRFNASSARFFIHPYETWICVFLILFIPITLGVLGLQQPVPSLACILLAFGFLLFLKEEFRKSAMALLVFRLIELIAFPLVTEVAANYLT